MDYNEFWTAESAFRKTASLYDGGSIEGSGVIFLSRPGKTSGITWLVLLWFYGRPYKNTDGTTA